MTKVFLVCRRVTLRSGTGCTAITLGPAENGADEGDILEVAAGQSRGQGPGHGKRSHPVVVQKPAIHAHMHTRMHTR